MRLTLVDEAHIGLTSKESGKFRELRRNRLNVAKFLLYLNIPLHSTTSLQNWQPEYDSSNHLSIRLCSLL